ncbi:uncharacterized protein CTRU02_201235 [Colletotrichum truncatum]|uniref:Uncharacterized protein n=1 Tax=Colletotrichum truncatum TaxID=5467 RepID=A0ACC3ZGP7_COLTU|nr:uncharacterized protein CTRU02_08024 [Colletotrichum truncatum]KAF6790504.1 hypothetical protein CTRU02_08024 [Colletotrichum truncatum]
MAPWTILTSIARWLPSPAFLPNPPLGSDSYSTSTPVNKDNDPKNTSSSRRRTPFSSSKAYSVAEVLSVAKIHPFYSEAQYPPDKDDIQAARERLKLSPTEVELKEQPLLRKKDLYAVIERLVNDTSPENTYRHSVYTSVTGGGSTNSKPLFFATDAFENRRHRAYFGQMLQNLGLVKVGDWALTTHCAGDLYRSLDLTCEIMENAGASVLAAGNHVAPSRTVQLLQDFNVNVLMGDGSQVLSVVHHISTMTTGREKIKLDKIIYTSEGLSAGQKSHIHRVLGPVEICSILGSAEAGPYGVSSPNLTPSDSTSDYSDFIIDTRMTLVEILPLSFPDGDIPNPLPEGETGVIAQTSLTRLRNPVVRYLTGDIGSLQPLPEQALSLIPEAHQPYMRVLRLQGRDQRFSFMWDGYDIEFKKLSTVMADPVLEILQWQVILDKMEPSTETSIELRVLSSRSEGKEIVVNRLEEFFWIYSSNKHKFRVTFVNDVTEFELSKTGRKVTKFVDRRN